MKILILCCYVIGCCFLNIGCLLAQKGSIEGTVVDEKGDPLGYVTVLIFDGEMFINGVKANEQGGFRLDSVDIGEYSLSQKIPYR